MESIYDPVSFRASEHFPTKEYFKNYAEICPLKKYKLSIAEELGVDENVDVNELEKICSIDKLTLPDEPSYLPIEIPEKMSTKTRFERYLPITEAARELCVIQCKENVESQRHQTEMMSKNKRFLKTSVAKAETSTLSDVKPSSTYFIYTIIVYRPFSINYGQKNSAEKLRYSHEIEALNTNTLADIADTISCRSNVGPFREVEHTVLDMNHKEGCPSQTIFIDGVFYNDLRFPDAIDYSAKIIEWAQEKNIGKFTTAEMDKTTLESLTPRLGYPYIYMHQGSCEHVIAFSDARLMIFNDPSCLRQYPQIVAMSRMSNILCFICSLTPADWMVTNCNKFPKDKVFLCRECCNSYLYVDGEKVTKFQLYPYFDDENKEKALNDSS